MRTQGSAEQLEVVRRIAGRLLLEGKGVCEIARILQVSNSSVSRWKQVVETVGLEGLTSKPHPGPAPRLSPEQLAELPRLLLAGAVSHGFPSDGWTCPRVADLIRQQFGVSYHPHHVWKVLQAIGFSCQLPEHRARERDDNKIAEWRRKEWQRIKKKRGGSEP